MEEAFGPREIRHLRRLLRYTQREMADRIGVSVSTIKAWESPPHVPRHRRPRRAMMKVMLGMQDGLCGR